MKSCTYQICNCFKFSTSIERYLYKIFIINVDPLCNNGLLKWKHMDYPHVLQFNAQAIFNMIFIRNIFIGIH
jgi:hypothetical protein